MGLLKKFTLLFHIKYTHHHTKTQAYDVKYTLSDLPIKY